MRHLFLLSIAVLGAAGPLQAASRFNCAVDDQNIRLTLDTGFADGPGRKLNHFRGAFIAKTDDAPAEFQKLVLGSDLLMQNWSYDGDLRIDIAAGDPADNGGKSFELVLMASGKDASAPMVGTYALTFWKAVDTPPVVLKGRLACNVRAPEE